MISSLEWSFTEFDSKTGLIELSGDLDLITVNQAVDQARELKERGFIRQIYDLAGLSHLDSSGIGFFLGAHNDLGKKGGGIAIARAGDYLLGIFSLVHLDNLVPVCQSVSEAKSSFDRSILK